MKLLAFRIRRSLAFGAAWPAFAVLLLGAGAAPAAALATTGDRPGLSHLLAAYDSGAVVRAVATFAAPPGAAEVATLQGLGLAVQPMRHVPLALVVGPVATLEAAVALGLADDVWPDEPVELFDTASSDAMGAAASRAAGLTGEGVTVAVVDSGCDASHPDLADHVAHNVKLYSGEYLNIDPDGTNTIVVPVEMLPYENSDIGGGHGTHVAGIVAADSTTDPAGGRFGVAPDAELVCYSIGEVLFTSAVVTAYDHLLDQPDLWDVDVVNNSWGNSFRQFDPRDPVAVVTQAVADLGVVVVFAAGNSGAGNAEMGLNPFSEAPWVLSVANGTLDHHRGSSSSSGLVYDNSEPTQIGPGGHTEFVGDRIGVYHPDVTAPGTSISSTCTPLGTAIGGCGPEENATASGTSMASPHVAGAAAVLLQANPSLTPGEVRAALQATATPVAASDGSALPFWQVGYGYVDLSAAVDLVRANGNWRKFLQRAQAKADARVLAADGFTVRRSDFWTYDAPRLAVGGSDFRTVSTEVTSATTHLKVTLSHPSLAVIGGNSMQYTVTVKDAIGRILGATTEAPTGAGTASLFLALGELLPPAAHGTFSFEVSGQRAVSDPDTVDSESLLGRMVTLQVAQLARD